MSCECAILGRMAPCSWCMSDESLPLEERVDLLKGQVSDLEAELRQMCKKHTLLKHEHFALEEELKETKAQYKQAQSQVDAFLAMFAGAVATSPSSVLPNASSERPQYVS